MCIAACADTRHQVPIGEEYGEVQGREDAEVPRYVPTDERLNDEGAAAEDFVRHALAMQGQPYRYGGQQPGGFDCSGLVNYAASRVGTRLPRTSRELLDGGRWIDRSELRRGDLLFFHGSESKLVHVGIYIGDDHFVHAPSTGGVVRIDDLLSGYYRLNFWQARRVQF